MATFEEIKNMLATISECGSTAEFGFTLESHDYMIIQYKDCCTIQRCGYTPEMAAKFRTSYIASEIYTYPTLDALYAATTVDGICLKDCWNQLDGMTIEDNTLDDFPFIVEAYKNSKPKQAYREQKREGNK